MSSLQREIFEKPLYGARRAVAEAESMLPKIEEKAPRERVDLFASKYPERDMVQHYRRQAIRVAQTRASYKQEMDKLLTLEKCILLLDAAEA